MPLKYEWPEGRRFAFTIFDDPDMQTTAIGREPYALLADLGFRTTRGVWPLPPTRRDRGPNDDCSLPEHVEWLRSLQARGFELGYHNARIHSSPRIDTIAALDRFRELFGHDPLVMANHFENQEAIYWGSDRLSGWRRSVYDILTRGQNRNRFFGHAECEVRFDRPRI